MSKVLSDVSTHASVRRRQLAGQLCQKGNGFNSRLREEATTIPLIINIEFHVSTHASVRRRLVYGCGSFMGITFQLTPP